LRLGWRLPGGKADHQGTISRMIGPGVGAEVAETLVVRLRDDQV
jgi:hypothetical protein